jgi:serine/threonine protein kinase/tetratricopeptide (TPR) repeat protein
VGLSTKQLGRLSELLDQSLPLSREERRAWLDALSDEDAPLIQPLREALLAEESDVEALRNLAHLPAMNPATSEEAATERRVGERLGAYELLQPLGAGGMAEVWLARRADGVFERQVALKIPRLRRVPAEMVERFARECKILATLECPGVARLYDAGVGADGTPYIAMEYVPGQPLIVWCDSRGLGIRTRVQLFMQVLDAVRQAHAHGIIHRDLKPSNILVTDQGEVRLLDFGVASLLQQDTSPRSLTRVYGRALTPEYASPELLRGNPVDVRSDIYSLGAVLHELLTGARPGQNTSEDGKTGPLSAELHDIIAKAMATAPADRYPDAATFAAALQRFASESAAAPARRSRVRYLVVGAAVALAALIGMASLQWIRSSTDSGTPSGLTAAERGVATIAILPFVDLSEGKDHGYLSDGLAEELIDLLTKVPELRVTARASSFAFRDVRVPIATIAGQLNVANVLEGSVRTSGNRLKFTVQLVRARDGTVIWSETYDRELQDIFEVQENVAAAVVEALKLRLLAGKAVPADRRTASVQAYTEYLVGRQYRDSISLERQQHALAAFQRAVIADPSFAPAHAGIALAAADIGSMSMSTASYDLALAEAERAMALAPRLVEPYVARAHVRMDRNWDYVGAKADLDVASGIDPNNVELLQLYAAYWWVSGNLPKALEIQRRNVARNPMASTAWDWLGKMLSDARDFPGARQALDRAEELSPYSDYSLLLRTLVELYSGNHEEALRLARSNPDPERRDYSVSMAAFAAGQSAEALAALEMLKARAPDRAAAQIAFIYALRGEREQTFAWLDRAIAARDPGLKGMQNRPEFDKFKGDPRFERVLRLMNIAGN